MAESVKGQRAGTPLEGRGPEREARIIEAPRPVNERSAPFPRLADSCPDSRIPLARPAGNPGRVCYGTGMRRIVPLILIALPLAACAAGTRPYPSLERRPAERGYGSGQPVSSPAPAPVATAPSGDLMARLASLRAQALAAHQAFEAKRAGAARKVAAAQGAAVASENWSVAQVALAELESARSNAMIALADLDSLLVAAARANVDAPTPDLPAVEKVRAEVTDWIGSEDEALAALRGRL